MSGLPRGRRRRRARVQGEFLTLLQSRGEESGADLDRLEDAVAFAGVSRYPARMECGAAAMDGMEGRGVAGSRTYDHCGGIMTTESTSEISIEDLTEAMRDVVDPEPASTSSISALSTA